MYRATRLLSDKLKTIDLYLEIRDSRIPLSSFNRSIDNIIKSHNKEKIVIFNKYDLCDKKKTDFIVKELQSLGIVTLTTSSKDRNFDFNRILKYSKTLKTEKFNTVGLWMMAGGIPNVGKSNIINNLRVLSKGFRNN